MYATRTRSRYTYRTSEKLRQDTADFRYFCEVTAGKHCRLKNHPQSVGKDFKRWYASQLNRKKQLEERGKQCTR